MEPATQQCEHCGRRVVDGATDFGGLVLRPTCSGIEVKVQATNGLWSRVCFVTESEMRDFLDRSYGPSS